MEHATPQGIKAWVRSTAHREPPTDWYGRCAGLTWQTIRYNGGVSGAPYGSATAAYDAARTAGKIESTDPSKAPSGAIHYWSYLGKDYRGIVGDWGHVAIDIYGGGTDVLSATHFAHEPWGLSSGLISVVSQSSRAGMKYLGWARTYGDHQRITIDAEGQAAESSTPIITQEWDTMATKDEIKDALREVVTERLGGAVSIVPLTEGGIYLLSHTTGKRVHIKSVYHLELIRRAIRNNSDDQMLPAELAIVADYLVAIARP